MPHLATFQPPGWEAALVVGRTKGLRAKRKLLTQAERRRLTAGLVSSSSAPALADLERARGLARGTLRPLLRECVKTGAMVPALRRDLLGETPMVYGLRLPPGWRHVKARLDREAAAEAARRRALYGDEEGYLDGEHGETDDGSVSSSGSSSYWSDSDDGGAGTLLSGSATGSVLTAFSDAKADNTLREARALKEEMEKSAGEAGLAMWRDDSRATLDAAAALDAEANADGAAAATSMLGGALLGDAKKRAADAADRAMREGELAGAQLAVAGDWEADMKRAQAGRLDEEAADERTKALARLLGDGTVTRRLHEAEAAAAELEAEAKRQATL